MKNQARIVLLLTLVLLGTPPARAADPVVVTSRSKQFVVRGQRQTLRPEPGVRNPRLVRVDPALLAVTCERVKDTLQNELGWGERWRGKIYIDVHPIRSDNEPVQATAVVSPEGWSYHLQMPDEIEPARLARTLVEVLLTEFANRASTGPRSAELPPWLAEGLAAHLRAGPLAGLVLEPDSVTYRHRETADSLAQVRTQLLAGVPLSVDRLNWPEPGQFEGEAAILYENCAHLFVRELLRLRAGPDCLCAMLALLPEHLNWQTAFLRAFQPHFKKMLDVEKWWSLNLVHFTGRTPTQLWTMADGLSKLDEVLYTPVEVRLNKSEMQHATFASLQTIIEEWDYPRQRTLLRQKLGQLTSLRLRLARDLVRLSDAYRETLAHYLERRDRTASSPHDRTRDPTNPRLIVSTALNELDALDTRRGLLRSAPARPTNAPAAGLVAPLTGR